MRTSPGKKYGYIIIPVIAPEGMDANAALDNDERYNVIWQVLRALRSHDERLEAEVNTIQYSTNRSGKIQLASLQRSRRDTTGDDYDIGREARQYLLDDFETAMMARLVHGLTWALFVKERLHAIKFGVLWKYLTPYCHCKVHLRVKHYIAGAIMPAVVLGKIGRAHV